MIIHEVEALSVITTSSLFFILFLTTDLGHQTAQKIVHASDPLQSMQDINQNFPSIVSTLSRMKVKYSVGYIV